MTINDVLRDFAKHLLKTDPAAAGRLMGAPVVDPDDLLEQVALANALNDLSCEELLALFHNHDFKLEVHLPDKLYTVQQLDARTVHVTTMRQIVLHTIGLIDSGSERHKPYTRHGKKYYTPWRNYFAGSSSDPTFRVLELAGYAQHDTLNDDQVLWHLTKEGLKWVGDEIGIVIHTESR